MPRRQENNFSLLGKSLTGDHSVPRPPVDVGTRHAAALMAPESSYVRLSTGQYTLRRMPSPHYIFASGSSLHSPSHFFISVRLSFPNQKPISTYALVDCGATTSCISERFATRHSLPRCLKDVPVPIMAVDDRPIASGLITQDVITTIAVGSHSETRPLAIVAVGYPIILGLDWLHQHNPNIDWENMSLSLDCCGLSSTSPLSVTARGYGLKHDLSHSTLRSTTVGLGFGLSSPSPVSALSTSNSTYPCLRTPHVHTLPPLLPQNLLLLSLHSYLLLCIGLATVTFCLLYH